jgi:hypothetical protein
VPVYVDVRGGPYNPRRVDLLLGDYAFQFGTIIIVRICFYFATGWPINKRIAFAIHYIHYKLVFHGGDIFTSPSCGMIFIIKTISRKNTTFDQMFAHDNKVISINNKDCCERHGVVGLTLIGVFGWGTDAGFAIGVVVAIAGAGFATGFATGVAATGALVNPAKGEVAKGVAGIGFCAVSF